MSRLLGCRLAGAGLLIEDELFGVEALCTMLVEVVIPAVVPPIIVAGLEAGIVLGVWIVPGLVWVTPVGVELPCIAIKWWRSLSPLEVVEELFHITKGDVRLGVAGGGDVRVAGGGGGGLRRYWRGGTTFAGVHWLGRGGRWWLVKAGYVGRGDSRDDGMGVDNL